MAKEIHVARGHGLGKEAASQKLNGMAGHLEERYGVKVNVSGDSADVTGRGVKGTCKVSENEIRVDLKLKMPASLVAGKIEQGIHKAIDEHFVEA